MIRRIALSFACLVSSVIALGAIGDPALLTSPKSGQVLHTPGIETIFWGPEWSDPTFAGDIVSGIDTLLAGYSNSSFAQAPTEYYDRSGHVTPLATYWGHVLDPSVSPAVGGLTSTAAIAEACKVTGNRPDAGSVYVVYGATDHAISGCAFHTWGTCGTGKGALPIQVAVLSYLSGIAGTGCDGVQDTATGHSLALAQMAHGTMHEVTETITDPRGTGWRDGNGDEIADKCLHVFPPDLSQYSVLSNGSVWKLAGLWSNAAYLSGSGTPNSVGQPGCIW
jgi:hypothetical protein